MRVRNFSGPTAQAAIARVREEMGEAAVIIAVDQAANGHGVVVRAATEEPSRTVSPAPDPRTVEERLEAFLSACLAAARHSIPAAL